MDAFSCFAPLHAFLVNKLRKIFYTGSENSCIYTGILTDRHAVSDLELNFLQSLLFIVWIAEKFEHPWFPWIWPNSFRRVILWNRVDYWWMEDGQLLILNDHMNTTCSGEVKTSLNQELAVWDDSCLQSNCSWSWRNLLFLC